MKSIITKDFGVTNARIFQQAISYPLANFYLTLGKELAWNATDAVEAPYDTTQYKLDSMNSGIVMKKLTSSDTQLVVPRVDWATGLQYYSYHQTSNLFIQTTEAQLLGGNVNVSLSLANTVRISGQSAPSFNFANATPLLSPGSIIRLSSELKEVVRVNTAGDYVQVNTNFSSAYSSESIYSQVSSSTTYSNPFYVRNTYDQVFKCMSNNSGAVSTTMPQISLGGQLPENPYIDTADGYKWKYMYTIPTGLKNKFFTDKYMPALQDTVVYDNATNGRIDIINIISGGTTYYAGGTTTGYTGSGGVTVVGDGTGAVIQIDVTEGVITNVHLVSGGSGYSYASVVINDPLKINGGTSASFDIVISPQYGHGYDAARELGASHLMISSDFAGDVSGYYPILNDGTDDFRRVVLVKNPKELDSGALATSALYSMFTAMSVSDPPVDYANDALVYVGNSFETANVTARVIHFDTASNIIYLNNIVGDLAGIETRTLYQQNNPKAASRIYTVSLPTINILTGEIMYIENRSAIVRNLNQTETVKLVLEF